jgi:hypothetical protein
MKAGRLSSHFRTLIVCNVLIGRAAFFFNFGLLQGQPGGYLAAICLEAFIGQRSLSFRQFPSLNTPFGIISSPAEQMRCPFGEYLRSGLVFRGLMAIMGSALIYLNRS